MNYLKYSIICAVLLLAANAFAVLGPSFSLDDDPSAPITSPRGYIPGFGAEDPYGLMLFGGPLAPSPTLAAVPAMDADLLSPSGAGGMVPVLDMPCSLMYNQNMGYVDAVSDNKTGRKPDQVIYLGFSVDRISTGVSPSAVNKQWTLNQQSGDVFKTDVVSQHPMNFLGVLPGASGYNGPLGSAGFGMSNLLVFDESRLNLTAGNGVGMLVGPNVMCPPIVTGTHDNVDAVNWQLLDIRPQDMAADRGIYLSVAPDERSISGFGPCDLVYIPAGAMAISAYVIAPGGMMGLYDEAWEWEDNIDALVVWEGHDGNIGQITPGIDFALFSLSAGSPSLAFYGLSEADIFFTNFTGAFWLYARANDLGLNWFGPQEHGDNVDALEAMILGDANLDGVVNLDDFIILKQNYGSVGASWLQGDFNGDGIVDLNDFIILKQHYGLTL